MILFILCVVIKNYTPYILYAIKNESQVKKWKVSFVSFIIFKTKELKLQYVVFGLAIPY